LIYILGDTLVCYLQGGAKVSVVPFF